jgi:predicted SAM-dependent methyltransferase
LITNRWEKYDLKNPLKKIIRIAIDRKGYDIIPKKLPISVPPFDSLLWSRLCDEYSQKLRDLGVDKAHYACGPRLLGDGWVNLDLSLKADDPVKVYLPVNLVAKHPFPADFFRFSFAEDFLEHLDQAESIIFLAEAFRTLRPGGVLRLSFPGLEGVLRKHYQGIDYAVTTLAQVEAYTLWEHKHFYCKPSLVIVARHIGFSQVRFLEYGKSTHQELCGLDYREEQINLNIYAELTK